MHSYFVWYLQWWNKISRDSQVPRIIKNLFIKILHNCQICGHNPIGWKKTLREKSVYLWIFVHLQKLKNPIRVGWIHLGHKIERDRQEHTSDTVVEWEVERKIPTPLRVCSIALCTFRNKNPCRELFHLATHLESVGLETTHSRSETLPAVLTAKYWLCATASSKAEENHLWTGWVMLLMYCTLLYQNNPQLVEFLHARVNLYLSDAATQPLLKNGWIDGT